MKYQNSLKIFFLFFLSLLIFNSSLLVATVRYVSHTGSNTPPYTSWATAADSIMSAINISVFGDTIYVANGVYEEQVIMIPGLSLIGAGMDSCVIDVRELVTSNSFVAVEVKDSCLLKGFHIMVYNNSEMGYGIVGTGNSLMILNRITNARFGVYISSTGQKIPVVYNNIIDNVRTGIELFNSNSLVKSNIIYTDKNYSSDRGINIGAFTSTYTPVIDSNLIIAGKSGIKMVFGTKATIKNNTIFINDNLAEGFFGGNPDTIWVYNNLIFTEYAWNGISNFIDPAFNYNNFLIGKFTGQGIGAENYNVIVNNTIINSPKGIIVPTGQNPVIKYNNSWNNEVNYGGFTPDSTNLSENPMVINEDSTQGELDFHLQMFSPLIDAGDPNILDVDSTRSDIGLYGGPFGESYKYFDLAPRPPVNLTAKVDSNYITVSWNHNTEVDFSFYSLFRDTTANFTADSTTFVADLTDTFYTHIIPEGVEAFYYKLTATDSQGNVSGLSEELAVLITSVKEYPTTVSNYRLYQNYPNPFNPSTIIGYKLKERGYVKLYVYDIKGELVEVLVNQIQDTGYYEVEFFGEVGSRQLAVSNRLASGIYIYQIMIKSENNIPVFTDMKKMVYLK